MIKINLIHPDAIKKVERSEFLTLGYGIIAVVFTIAAVRYASQFANYRKIESRIASVDRELAKHQNIIAQVDSLQATKSVMEMKKKVISSLMASRLVYPQFMEEITGLLPVNIWFRSLATQSQPDGKLSVVLDAESLDNFSIADFITSLSGNPDFSNVELGAINTVTTNKVTSSAFRLNFIHQKKPR
jgi:Tfp pilus assembly protein PilN